MSSRRLTASLGILAVVVAMGTGCATPRKGDTETLPLSSLGSERPTVAEPNPVIVIETSLGAFTAELWPDKAPETVANLLRYVDKAFYDGLIFHRVIDGFMIQGGGFTPDQKQKPPAAAIRNEATGRVLNIRGTLAMARTADIDSASSQFFINLVDNRFLDHKDNTSRGYGYCVFGKVIDGMDVVDRIGKVETHNVGFLQNLPVEPVVIKSIRRQW